MNPGGVAEKHEPDCRDVCAGCAPSSSSMEVAQAYQTLGDKLLTITQAYDQALVSLKEARVQRDEAIKERDSYRKMWEVAMSAIEDEDAKKVARLQVGDLVSGPANRTSWGMVASTEGGRIEVFYRCGEPGYYVPGELQRKPLERGDTVRCVKGPYEREIVSVVGVDRNYVEIVREGHTRVHVLDRDQVAAVRR